MEHKAGGSGVHCARVVASGASFVCQSHGCGAALIRCDTQRAEALFRGHGGWLASVDEHPSGAFFASGCGDSCVRLFERSGALVWSWSGHGGAVYCVQFSPDGALLASSSNDRTIRLWSVPSGAEVGLLEGHTDLVVAVAFSPDGRTLLSGSNDCSTRLWRVAMGEQLRVLDGCGRAITLVALSRDGQWTATSSGDEAGRLLARGARCRAARMSSACSSPPTRSRLWRNPARTSPSLAATVRIPPTA